MIEAAMNRFEEGAAIGAILLAREPRRRIVKPAVGPGIVMTEHLVMRCGGHRYLASDCFGNNSSRGRVPRDRPVAQPRSHRATGQVQGEHDEAEVEPIA